MASINEISEYIWRRSRDFGVNPSLALGIAKYEGLNPNTIGSKTFGNPDKKGYSFGPYQLYSASSDPSNIAPGGMAYEFKQKFGEAPSRDNWQQQVDFSLETMSKRGTSPWYAVRDRGGEGKISELGAQYARQLGLSDNQPNVSPVQVASSEPSNSWSQATNTLLGTATGGLLGQQRVPTRMGIDSSKFAASAEPGYSGEAGKMIQPAAQDYGFKNYAPAAGDATKAFAGLGAAGLALMALGAPRQTWTPGPAAPVHRGQWRDDIFAGLLGL